MWKAIRNGFWKGVRESNERFEAERGYPPDQEIQRGIDRGRDYARRGLGPFGGELKNEDQQDERKG